MTARRVAAQRLSFARLDDGYGRPDADDRLQADVAAGVDTSDTPLKPYLQARTRFFDGVVVEWIARGLSQIVLVGAGYDGRSLRYAKPGVRWFELDHPDTQADKTARLTRLGITSNGLFVPVDFTTGDVAEALRHAGFEATTSTLFCCEGVAGYLPAAVMGSLLRALAGSACGGSALAISVSLEPVTEDGRARRQRLGAAVASVGEPLVSAVPRSELCDTLAATGWTVERATDPGGNDIESSTSNAAFVVAVR